MNAIFYNALIYPQFQTAGRPSAVVITKNKISAIGNNLQAFKKEYPKHRLVNVGGRVIIPGLVDSHTHFFFWARTINTVQLNGLKSFGECLKKIKTFAATCEPNEWIVGSGWSPDRWDEYHSPTAQDLDSVTGACPAALFSKDQHMLWVNSKALKLAKISRKTPQPCGGRIDKDPASGDPTGILKEVPSYYSVLKLINRPNTAQVEKNWKIVSKKAYSRGVTGFHSMDGAEGFKFFQRLHKKNKLGFRAHYYYPVEMLDELINKGITSGQGDETLQVGGVKLYADGSLGAQTALMKKPYKGTKDRYGVEVTMLADLKRNIKKANKNNLACAVHAIGDQAVSNVISGFEAAELNSLRNRIEHMQLVSSGDMARLLKAKIIASMQPSHCPSDRGIIRDYWGARGKNAFIFKTLLKKNIPLAFGSDGPIEPIDPLVGISAAVNRTGFGERGGKFYPEECLTVAQAVYGFTTGAAYAAGRELYSGKIAPGYQADVVILNDNIYSMPPSQIYKTTVAATIFDGKIVYRDKQNSLKL